MINKITSRGVTLLNLHNPTQTETRTLVNEYSVAPAVSQDILLPNYKDKLEIYDKYFYVVLHFPAFKHNHNNQHRQEIDFVVGANYLITNTYESIEVVDKFTRGFEVNSLITKQDSTNGTGPETFLALMDALYDAMGNELDSIKDSLRSIEARIYHRHNRQVIVEISHVGRRLINFDQILVPHFEVFDFLKKERHTLLPLDAQKLFESLLNKYEKIARQTKHTMDLLRELRLTNDSLFDAEQNEIMRTLTVIAFISLPLSIMTGFFQMNTRFTPLVGGDNDWWLLMGIMTVATAILLLIAKIKKWF